MNWKKALMVLGVVVALLVVVGAGTLYAMTRPATLVPYQDDLSPATRDAQTRITFALDLAGIESALAVIADGTVTVGYQMPAGDGVSPEDWQRTVLGAVAPLAPESMKIVAVQLVDETPSIQWSVATEKVLAYADGAITAEELESAIEKTAL